MGMILAIGIYPTSTTTEYTENSPVQATDYLSELAIAWEKAARLPPEDGVRQVIIRSGLCLYVVLEYQLPQVPAQFYVIHLCYLSTVFLMCFQFDKVWCLVAVEVWSSSFIGHSLWEREAQWGLVTNTCHGFMFKTWRDLSTLL